TGLLIPVYRSVFTNLGRRTSPFLLASIQNALEKQSQRLAGQESRRGETDLRRAKAGLECPPGNNTHPQKESILTTFLPFGLTFSGRLVLPFAATGLSVTVNCTF